MSRQARPGKWRSTYLREECFGTAWQARVGPLERACQRTESASMKAGCLRELTSNWDCSKGTCPFTANSLLKYSFGSSFRGARRPGISLFVGFRRGGIPCCARNGEFRSLFQQAANRLSPGKRINRTFEVLARDLSGNATNQELEYWG